MAYPSSAVSKQWDPAVTAFSTLDRLRGLAIATTQDDVQLNAVLAIERLGARLIVSPKLISDGVDALKGNESVRLAHARLLIGLSWGGVAAQLRLSTACVRAFLLISAIKICAYDDQGIADIIYEYLSSAKLLDSVPVSVQQLKGLIDVLSGYSDALLPSIQRTMDEVISFIANQGPEHWPRSCLDPLAIKSIAEIFLRCFEAIQQDEGGYIEISGQNGLIWIATVLSWLSPDEVGLFSQGHLLFGAAQGKVRIMVCNTTYITAEDSISWKMETWKAGKSVTTMISADDTLYWVPPRRRSGKILRSNMRYFLRNEGFDEGQLDLVGALAAGLIDATLCSGTLIRFENSFDPEIVPLKLLYEQSFVEKGGRIMEEYGWELDNIRTHATNALAQFTELFESSIPLQESIEKLMIHFVQTTLMSMIENIETRVEERRHQAFADRSNDHAKSIVNRAVCLAGHALASAQANFGTLVQFYYPYRDSFWITELLVGTKSPQRKSIEGFVKQTYIAAGVDFQRNTGDSVIVASDGRVLFPRAMLDHSTRRNSLCELVVLPGRIHYDGSCFDAVVDFEVGRIYNNVQYEAPRRVPIFDQNTRQLVLRVPYEQSSATLQYFFAKDQRRLLMRIRLYSEQDDSGGEVNYRDCLENLAFAVHVEKAEDRLSTRLSTQEHSLSRLDEITLIGCLTHAADLVPTEPQPFLTLVPDSQELRFFASHPIFQPISFRLCILQGVEVIEALYTIMPGREGYNPNKKRWRIITGKDG